MIGGENLGFVIKPTRKAPDDKAKPTNLKHGVNTRTSLWPTRWPAIALQSCIDTVEAAPREQQAEVKYNLPCNQCEASTRCLNAKKKELGPLMYDREILTNPRSSESSLFPMELIQPMMREDMELLPHWRKPYSLESYYAVVQAWDVAWSEKIGGDYLVCMTASVDLRTGHRTLLDIQRWQQLSFDQQMKLIEQKAGIYGADLVVIESDAAQKIWKQQMARNTAVPVVEHSAGEKKDLQSGVPGILIQFVNKKWTFPYKPGSLRHDEVQNFMAELEAFGWVDGKLEGIGEHDDTVMCFYHLWWGCNKFAQEAGFGDEFHAGVVPGARQ